MDGGLLWLAGTLLALLTFLEASAGAVVLLAGISSSGTGGFATVGLGNGVISLLSSFGRSVALAVPSLAPTPCWFREAQIKIIFSTR